MPDEGFQIISGTRQEQFLHNTIGGVIIKQRNRREQRLDFLPDSGDILLFLAQNVVRILHECLSYVQKLTRENRGYHSVEIEDFSKKIPIPDYIRRETRREHRQCRINTAARPSIYSTKRIAAFP